MWRQPAQRQPTQLLATLPPTTRLPMDATPEEICRHFDISKLSQDRMHDLALARTAEGVQHDDSGYHSPDLSDDEDELGSVTVVSSPRDCAAEDNAEETCYGAPSEEVMEDSSEARALVAAPPHTVAPRPLRSYLGYDRMTSSDDMNAYLERLHGLILAATPFFAPTILNTFWPLYGSHDFIAGPQVPEYGTAQIQKLATQWLKTRRSYGPCYMDKSRMIVLPVHDPETEHWMLLLGFPQTNHCVALCSLPAFASSPSPARVFEDNFGTVHSRALSRAMRVLSRAVYFSRYMRRVYCHYTSLHGAKGPASSDCEGMQQFLKFATDMDPHVFHNAPNFSYSYAYYGTPQTHLDCGVYVLEAARRVLLSDCSDPRLAKLIEDTKAYASCCQTIGTDMLSLLGDDSCTDPGKHSVLYFYLKESRRRQIIAFVQFVVGNIDEHAIARARKTLLVDLSHITNMTRSVPSMHLRFTPLLHQIDAYLENLSPDSGSYAKSPVAIGTMMIRWKDGRTQLQRATDDTHSSDTGAAVALGKRKAFEDADSERSSAESKRQCGAEQ